MDQCEKEKECLTCPWQVSLFVSALPGPPQCDEFVALFRLFSSSRLVSCVRGWDDKRELNSNQPATISQLVRYKNSCVNAWHTHSLASPPGVDTVDIKIPLVSSSRLRTRVKMLTGCRWTQSVETNPVFSSQFVLTAASPCVSSCVTRAGGISRVLTRTEMRVYKIF